MKLNLHAHSQVSDGVNRISEMVAAYKALGFSCAVITDHVYTVDRFNKFRVGSDAFFAVFFCNHFLINRECHELLPIYSFRC